MDNVVLMPGVVRTDLPADEQPQQSVIKFLSDLHDEAVHGKIQAIAVCYVRPGCVTGEGVCIPRGGVTAQLISATMADMFIEHYSRRRADVTYETIDPAS